MLSKLVKKPRRRTGLTTGWKMTHDSSSGLNRPEPACKRAKGSGWKICDRRGCRTRSGQQALMGRVRSDERDEGHTRFNQVKPRPSFLSRVFRPDSGDSRVSALIMLNPGSERAGGARVPDRRSAKRLAKKEGGNPPAFPPPYERSA